MNQDPEWYLLDVATIGREQGFAWLVAVPEALGPGDTPESPLTSVLQLFENDRPLGQAHALHDEVRATGRGAYSHWHDVLYFSTSDGSDPRANGRAYRLRVGPATGPHPAIVGIETINVCNARCPFCPLFQGPAVMDRAARPPTVMRPELFETCVRQVAGWAIRPQTIFLNMDGEPLQDPLFAERLALIGELGLGSRVNLQTNGQFLTERLAEAILAAGVGCLSIGFDGASRQIYEQHRVRCDYDRVLDNIRRFVAMRRAAAHRTVIAIKYVRTRRNDHEVVAAYQLFARLLDADLDVFTDTLSEDWGDQFGDADLFFNTKSEPGTAVGGCAIFDAQLIVHSDGTVAACCWDYNLNVSRGGFGNAADAPLIELWRGDKRTALQEQLNAGKIGALPEKCRTCPSLAGKLVVDKTLAKFRGEGVSYHAGAFSYRFIGSQPSVHGGRSKAD